MPYFVKETEVKDVDRHYFHMETTHPPVNFFMPLNALFCAFLIHLMSLSCFCLDPYLLPPPLNFELNRCKMDVEDVDRHYKHLETTHSPTHL